MSDENVLGELAKELDATGLVSTKTGDVTSYMAHEDGKIITGTVQDWRPIAEEARKLRDSGSVGSSEMRLVARLPLEAVERYCVTHGITFAEWQKDPVHARRMTTDPDLAGFRVWDGKNGGIRSVGGFETVN